MTTTDAIQPEQAGKILQTIAVSNPDYAAFQVNHADMWGTDKSLPTELIQDTLSVLAEDPNLSSPIEALSNNLEARKSFSPGGEVVTLIAVVFLLRTHIKLKRNTSGKWEFIIEHKPGDSKLMLGVLKKLGDWMGGVGLS
jgi:hypothetical protein